MAQRQNTSLVPVKKKLPAIKSKNKGTQPFTIFDGERHFTDREDVREFLPDILGRALARTWIDPEFHKPLMAHAEHWRHTTFFYQKTCQSNSSGKTLTGQESLFMSNAQIQNSKCEYCTFNL